MSHILYEPLYHGTIVPFKKVDVSRGKGRRDFGRGFYMAVSAEQAIGMMHKKFREALSRRRDAKASDFTKTLYRFRLKPDVVETLNVKVFSVADMEWLDFILMCRESELDRPHDFDVVIGPTADDDTLVSLQNYWKGVYGPLGSKAAKDALLSVLEPENLGIQCCLCSEKSVSAVMAFTPVNWRMFV